MSEAMPEIPTVEMAVGCQTRQKWIKVLIHFLCLGMLFILPEVLLSSGLSHPVPAHVYYKALIFVGVFYINYYLIIDRCLSRPRWSLRLVSVNIVVIAVAMGLLMLPVLFTNPPAPRYHELSGSHEMMLHASHLLRDIIMLVLTAGLAVAMKLGDRWVAVSRRQKEMEAANQAAELESLRSQLNPHFLFNSLNMIYALSAIRPEKAQEAIHLLSSLLRHMLYSPKDMVTLESETDFIRSYVELMKMRLGDSAEVDLSIDLGGMGCMMVAPMLFINVVENAFKHGLHGLPGERLSIDFTVNADLSSTGDKSRKANTVSCRVCNSSPSASSAAIFSGESADDRRGIGLTNLSRRLDLLYGSRASIEFSSSGGTHNVVLHVPLSMTPTPP